jgi:putative multiple sugar transport system permease protein
MSATVTNAPKTNSPTPPARGVLQATLSYLAGQLRQLGLFIALIAIVILLQVLTNGVTLSPRNVSNLVVQNSYILILAIGMVMVIIAGHIDLSVGSVVAVIGALAGVLNNKMDLPWLPTIILCLAAGALVGAWQGFWIAYFKIPAFIVTLGGMLAFRGLAQILLKNTQISPFDETFRKIGSGFLPDLGGGTSYLEPLTMILAVLSVVALVVQGVVARRGRARNGLTLEPLLWFLLKIAFMAALVMVIAWQLASYRGTPIVLVILGFLVVAYSAVMANTVFGRQVYAIGGNLRAAELSGVNASRASFLLFVNMGVLSAIAGLVFTAQLNLAGPSAGNGFELDAIAAVFIGGAAVTGGIGTVGGAIVGGLIIGILNNGMTILGVGTEWQEFIKGMVLLAAVAFDVFNKRRAARSA